MKITCPRCKRRIRLRRGKNIKCKCGKNLDYRHYFKKQISNDVFLIDANIFIYAFDNSTMHQNWCLKTINYVSQQVKLATTKKVLTEVGGEIESKMPESVKIYKPGQISKNIRELQTNYLKQPSQVDLSLIQAAIEHPEIRGLITYDKDFDRMATSGLIEKKSVRKFWLMNAKEFCQKYEIKSNYVERVKEE